VYLCVSGIDLVFFHDFDIEFRVVFFVFHFITRGRHETRQNNLKITKA
jgi:hypothetical protein